MCYASLYHLNLHINNKAVKERSSHELKKPLFAFGKEKKDDLYLKNWYTSITGS